MPDPDIRSLGFELRVLIASSLSRQLQGWINERGLDADDTGGPGWKAGDWLVASKRTDRQPFRLRAIIANDQPEGDFIACAYRSLLGREVDPGGENHYRERLSAGMTRHALLEDMLASTEGKARGEQFDISCAGEDHCP